MTYWTAAYTAPGAECAARRDIEGVVGRGTFVPTYAEVRKKGAEIERATERPILKRYVLVALKDAYDPAQAHISMLHGVHGVLHNGGAPMRVADAEIQRLMMMHIRGDLNVVQYRDALGRFSRVQKSRVRRARPRPGKRARARSYLRDGSDAAISAAT